MRTEGSGEGSLEARTVAELRELARQAGLKGYTRLSKTKLIELLSPPEPEAVSELMVASSETPGSTDGRTTESAPPEPVIALPESYGVNRCVLRVRDPEWLFAYWDVSGDTYAELIRQGVTYPGNGWQRVLRVYDVTDGQSALRDIELDEVCRDYYFEAPATERSLAVEYGYRSAAGEFLCIARSNTIEVPRMAPSPRSDERWGALTEEAYLVSLAGGRPTSGLGSAEASERLQSLLREGISSGHFLADPAAVASGD